MIDSMLVIIKEYLNSFTIACLNEGSKSKVPINIGLYNYLIILI